MIRKIVFTVLAAILAVGCGAYVGGRRPAEAGNVGVQNALNFAVREHNKGTNDTFLFDAVKVVKAETQLVAGMNYFITVLMGRTGCKKGGQEQVCAIQEDPELAREYMCTFTVYHVPWTHTITLMAQSCQI